MTDRTAAFRSFPASAFPFTVTFVDHDTLEIVHTIEVSGPGAVEVPKFGRRKLDVIVERADGVNSVHRAPDD